MYSVPMAWGRHLQVRLAHGGAGYCRRPVLQHWGLSELLADRSRARACVCVCVCVCV